jgi:hypothetical protein
MRRPPERSGIVIVFAVQPQIGFALFANGLTGALAARALQLAERIKTGSQT